MWHISGFQVSKSASLRDWKREYSADTNGKCFRKKYRDLTFTWRLRNTCFALAENSFDVWLVRDLLKWWRGLARGTWRRWRRSLHLGLASVVRPSSDFSSWLIGASSSLTSHSTVANSQARRRNEVLVYLNWTLIYYVHYLVYHYYYYKI